MVKVKSKSKDKKFILHLTCDECGLPFKSERFKKYCSYICQRAVNKRFAKIRYANMRELFLRSKGVIK